MTENSYQDNSNNKLNFNKSLRPAWRQLLVKVTKNFMKFKMASSLPMKSGILSKVKVLTSAGLGTPFECFAIRSSDMTIMMKNAEIRSSLNRNPIDWQVLTS